MAKRPLPSPEVLRQLLRCEPGTGSLFWLERPNEKSWNARFAGKPAFHSINSHGYRTGAVKGYSLKAHRVIWAMSKGAWPEGEIDHINGDRLDNRLDNLREVSKRQNAMNRHAAFGSSQFKGVKKRAGGRWQANIKVADKYVYLGTYASEAEAALAYNIAASAHYGDYARLNAVS